MSEVFHFEGGFHVTGTSGRAPGPDPKVAPTARGPRSAIRTATAGCSRRSRRGFPDEGSALDVATLTELLRETEEHHGAYEATAPKHHWSGWYAAYIVARERRADAEEEAAKDAGRPHGQCPPMILVAR